MRIQNNVAAFNVWSSYSKNVTAMQESMGRLSTGVIQNTDDPAGLGISERMRGQIKGTAMARQNTDNAISMLQTADAWLQKVNDITSRMKALSIEAGGIASDGDKKNIQTEFAALQDEIKRITSGDSAAAQFNGVVLFEGSTDSIQVGPDAGQNVDLSIPNLSSSNSTIIGSYTNAASVATSMDWNSVFSDSFSVTSSDVLAQLDIVTNHVSNARAQMAAQQNRLAQTRDGLLAYEDNLTAAESKIRDVDMARETTEFSKFQVLTQTSNAMLAQANKLPEGITQLLQ
ncbi:flagellin [Lentisphaerota bacterium WC36G]|nr:flagellin [Lentisphaerae bacterium WC36]